MKSTTKNTIKAAYAVRLRPEQLKKLHALAKKNPETCASSIIRQALDAFLK